MVYSEKNGMRADLFLAKAAPEHSRSFYQKLFGSGNVLVNGNVCRPGRKLEEGDRIEISFEAPADTSLTAVPMPLDIIYEDGSLMVINKPAGLVVHPAAGHRNDTLVNGLLAHSEDIAEVGEAERPGIVHRLDKDTSGLLCVAKTEAALHSLSGQIARREMHRRYTAVLIGDPGFERATVDAPIGRSPSDRQKQAVIKDTEKYSSRPAVTHIRILERYRLFALAECVLDTGRTHQIRVHASFIGHPVLGDALYGGIRKKPVFPSGKAGEKEFAALTDGLGRQLLHASGLSFRHPVTGEPLSFEAPLPEEFRAVVDFLRKEFSRG